MVAHLVGRLTVAQALADDHQARLVKLDFLQILNWQ